MASFFVVWLLVYDDAVPGVYILHPFPGKIDFVP